MLRVGSGSSALIAGRAGHHAARGQRAGEELALGRASDRAAAAPGCCGTRRDRAGPRRGAPAPARLTVRMRRVREERRAARQAGCGGRRGRGRGSSGKWFAVVAEAAAFAARVVCALPPSGLALPRRGGGPLMDRARQAAQLIAVGLHRHADARRRSALAVAIADAVERLDLVELGIDLLELLAQPLDVAVDGAVIDIDVLAIGGSPSAGRGS